MAAKKEPASSVGTRHAKRSGQNQLEAPLTINPCAPTDRVAGQRGSNRPPPSPLPIQANQHVIGRPNLHWNLKLVSDE